MQTTQGDDGSQDPKHTQPLASTNPPTRPTADAKLTTNEVNQGGADNISTTVRQSPPLRPQSPRTSDETLISPTTSTAASPTTPTLSSTPTTPRTSGIPDLQELPSSTLEQPSQLPSGLILEQSVADFDDEIARRLAALKDGETYIPSPRISEGPPTPKTFASQAATQLIGNPFSPENSALQVLDSTQKSELEALKAKLAEPVIEVDTAKSNPTRLAEIESLLGTHENLDKQSEQEIYAWIQEGFKLLGAQAPRSVSAETSKDQLLAYAAVLQGIAATELRDAEIDSSLLNTPKFDETPAEWVARVLDTSAIEAAISAKLTKQDEWATIEACLAKVDTVEDFKDYSQEMSILLNIDLPEDWESIPAGDNKYFEYATSLRLSVQAAMDNALSEPSAPKRYDVTPMTPVEPLTPASLAPTSDVVEPVLTTAPTSTPTPVIPTLTTTPTTLSAGPAPALANTWVSQVVGKIKSNQTVLGKLDPKFSDTAKIAGILSEQPAAEDVGAHRKKIVDLLQALGVPRAAFDGTKFLTQLDALGISPPNRRFTIGSGGDWTSKNRKHDASSTEGQQIIALSNELSKFVADKLQVQVVQTAPGLVQTPTQPTTVVPESQKPIVFTAAQKTPGTTPATVLQSLATPGGTTGLDTPKQPLIFRNAQTVQKPAPTPAPAAITSSQIFDDPAWTKALADVTAYLKTKNYKDPTETANKAAGIKNSMTFEKPGTSAADTQALILERDSSDHLKLTSHDKKPDAQIMAEAWVAAGNTDVNIETSVSAETAVALFEQFRRNTGSGFPIKVTFGAPVIKQLQEAKLYDRIKVEYEQQLEVAKTNRPAI